MIRSLRQKHRAASVALAIGLPIGIVAALNARVVWPTESASADALGPDSEAAQVLADLWGEHEIVTRLWNEPGEAPTIELAPTTDLMLPDVLLYWQPAGEEGAPSPTGRLLGSVAGTQARLFSLPEDARSSDGTLVLYSLGHAEVVATAKLAALGS